MKKGAIIDSSGQYRYSLWREWDAKMPRIAFIMLNPSRADAESDDPTIRRCIGFAKDWGYGSLEVVNLFAYRAQNPKLLQQVLDPIGLENKVHLQKAVKASDCVVIAWGNGGRFKRRNDEVLRTILPRTVYCLGITKQGQPKHPLYLSKKTRLINYFDPQCVAVTHCF